ncbi:MAG: lysylphosphatidylglycerol synthase transmembrane domain-containing protein [Elusimicrobiota bacterium]
MTLIKRKLTLFLGILLSIFFLFLALRKVDFLHVRQLFMDTNYLYIIPCFFIYLAEFNLRAYRWWILVSPIKKGKYINFLSATHIGFFSNTILPMRAGEIVKVLLICGKEKISKASMLATLIIERAMDIFALLTMIYIASFFFSYPESIKKILLVTILILAGFILVFYGLMYYRSGTIRFISIFFKVLPAKFRHGLKRALDLFIDGLEILKKTHHVILTLTLSISIWLSEALLMLLIAKGMGINGIDYFGTMFLIAIIAIGTSIPSSPGYVGVFEYFGILACSVLGIAKSTALGYILFFHAFQLVTLSAAGMFFVTREHISIVQLEQEAEQEDQ